MEQRLTVDDSRTSFFYPYLIRRDVHGQQIVPENLGYMPLEAPRVEHLLRAARANRVVRDGFASAFFHPFVRLAALDELVQGIKQLGYTFTDVRRFAQVVRAGDKAVITGRGDVTLTLADRYLREYRFNEFGNLVDETGTSTRVTGELTRHVRLPHEWLYVAEASATPPPPYWIRQGRHAVQTIVQPFTLTRQFREARRAGAHIGPVQWLALGVSLGVVSLAAVGTIALTALRVHRAVVRRRERAHA
jgi:hypothetical protein